MASRTEIANLAISHLGIGKDIANIDTENSEEANACRRFFDIARDQCLRDFDWPFASKYVSLGLVEEDPNDDYQYSYRYPSDCLSIRKILSGTRNETHDSRIAYFLGQDDSGLLIFTDQPLAQIKYTVRTTNPLYYPADFMMALSYRLAALIAPRLTVGDSTAMALNMIKLYQVEISRAQANAGNEEQPDVLPESEFIRGRE